MTNRHYFVFKSFCLGICLFYLPGLLLFPFFEHYYSSHYSFKGTPYAGFYIVASLFAISYFVVYALSSKVKIKIESYVSSVIVGHIFFALALLFFVSSVIFSINYSASFRHVNRLNDAGIWVTFLFAVAPLLSIYSLFALIHILNGNRLGVRSKLVLLLYLVGTVISLNSALQSITLLIVFVILVRPIYFLTPLNSLPITRLVLVAFGMIICTFIPVAVGLGNKMGYEFIFSNEGFNYAYVSLGHIIARISSSLMSNASLFDCCMFDSKIGFDTMEGFSSTFYNRLSSILPIGDRFDYDMIKTVNRENYLLIFTGDLLRAGASPGVLASVFYLPLFPLGVILLAVFYSILSNVIASKLSQSFRYNIFSMVAIVFFILPFFEAPLNTLYIIDPLFISFLVFIGFVYVKTERVFSR